MTPTLERPTLTREFVCDQCGLTVSTDDLLLLRERCALPEEPAMHVHKACVDRYLEDHPGRWHRIDAHAPEAGWWL